MYKVYLFLVTFFLVFYSDIVSIAYQHPQCEKITKKTKKYSYSYGIKLKNNSYSLLVITKSYRDETIKDSDVFDLNEPVLTQQLYFLKGNDTIKSLTVDSNKGILKLKRSKRDFNYSKNQLKFIGVIKGKNDFFYYLSGGEDCVSGCPEYYAFYDKKGNLLWKSYLKYEGNYSKTLNSFKIKKGIFNKNSLKLIRVTPYNEIGTTINSSLIKFQENR